MVKEENKIKSIIAIIILIVIVSTATFAFFGTFSSDLTNNVAVNISSSAPGDTTFTTTSAVLELNVPSESMFETNANNNEAVASNSAILNVSLIGTSSNVSTTCTYDIVFEYDMSSNVYGVSPTTKTSGVDKEITFEVSSRNGTNNFPTEKNIDYNTSNGWTASTSTTGAKITLVSGAIISVSKGNQTSQSYSVTARYYNLNTFQGQLVGQSFTGKIYVDNYDCDSNSKEDKTLYSLVRKKYTEGNTFVNLYDGDGSDSYANPVYYYNGAVEDNNVLFANLCWKIVRTTDTGGVKLIYNGKPQTIYENVNPVDVSMYSNISNDTSYPYTFDSTNKTWTSTNKTDGATGTITFTVAEAGDYVLSYTVSSEEGYDKAIFYKDDVTLGTYSGSVSGTINLEGLTTSNVIKVEYTKDNSSADGSDNVVFSLGKPSGNSYLTCNNTGTDSQIGESAFNSSYNSPAYVGYMYNTVYTISRNDMSSLSNIVFGNSFTYSGGTYTLTDTMAVATWSSGYNTINNNHYTCFTTGTTCSSLYYVYYTDSSYAYYITLTGGKSVSDALNEMLYADDVNTTDSAMKTYIETWYKNNMTAYTSYLEDTTFCNDRSILSLGGWNPNGGSTREYLQFKNYNTNYSLVCGSVTDQFRVENTKAPLKYPVGLLTIPEVWLAYKDASYSTYYLNTGQDYWLGSPSTFSYNGAFGRYVNSAGLMGSDFVDTSNGARPSVSLKPGTMFVSGDGAYTDPFVIE